MGNRKHALISPSGAHRSLMCTPSARLEDKLPDNETDYAREGTLAHSVAENYLEYLDQRKTRKEYIALLEELREHELYKPEMLGHGKDYAEYVYGTFTKVSRRSFGTSPVRLFIELKIDLSNWIPESYGHLDAAVADMGEQVLYITDYKYGQGVPVDAEENEQMMYYAIGTLDKLDGWKVYKKVVMTIYQPRINNISTWEIPVRELHTWGLQMMPIMEKAFRGEGEFVAGDHCRFCRAAATCRVRAEYIQGITDGLNYALPELLTAKEISKILTISKEVQNYLQSVEKHALSQALKGKKFPGFKVVEGLSRRKIVDEKKAAKRLSYEYYEDQYMQSSLKTLGELEALVGVKELPELLTGLLVKPKGSPTLVPDEGKHKDRVEFNSAADVFKHVIKKK